MIEKEVYPTHSFLNEQLCVDERIGSSMLRTVFLKRRLLTAGELQTVTYRRLRYEPNVSFEMTIQV